MGGDFSAIRFKESISGTELERILRESATDLGIKYSQEDRFEGSQDDRYFQTGADLREKGKFLRKDTFLCSLIFNRQKENDHLVIYSIEDNHRTHIFIQTVLEKVKYLKLQYQPVESNNQIHQP